MSDRDMPPMKPSDEAKPETLRLAQEQGDALDRALRHMISTEAQDGREIHVGEYRVAYAVEKAEGLWHLRGDELVWEEPEDANVHVEIAVRDAADGRFLPGLDVQATLIDAGGREVGTHAQPFLWHPWLYHYGRNWTVPGDGSYTLRIRVAVPDFPRHDKVNGRRFLEAAVVEFTNVRIQTGRK